MRRRFFDPEGLLWKPLGILGDLVMLSLLWGVCSIPLFTLGPATAALYDCIAHCVRGGEIGLFSRFFRTFKAEFRRGSLSTLLWAALLALPVLALRFAQPSPTPAGRALSIGCLLLLFLLLAALVWVFPLLSRFSFDFAGLNRTAPRLAFGHMLRSAAAALLTLLGFLACYFFTSPLIFVPGLVALLWSWLMEPVFQRYSEPGKE